MTITLTREEAADVLYALAEAAGCVQENYQPGHMGHGWGKEIETLRARLSAPEPEPVAWLKKDRSSIEVSIMSAEYMKNAGFEPLYTAQPQREWQGLTDEERLDAEEGCMFIDEFDPTIYADNIEAKLKEKNT
jgi:hypothetical protein